jgi:hypothetical protein
MSQVCPGASHKYGQLQLQGLREQLVMAHAETADFDYNRHHLAC